MVSSALTPVRFAVVLGLALSIGCEEIPADTVSQTFEIAGVVEGFYGTPWSHSDRIDVINFMGEVGLNTYFYAPKADPYHLSQWREPYPPAEWDELRALTGASRSNGVTFWYAISPGLTMQYSAAADYAALLSKIDTIATLGVRHFGLFLDDVPLELTHADDIREYGDLGSAHVSLINRLHVDLMSRGSELAVTPTVYTSAWDSPSYINQLGDQVHPDVRLIWTGPDVATSQITHQQSAAWSNRLGRRIILWDNYPVNDFAPWRLFLGPLRGRDRQLPRTTVGILSNPMNQAHASMVPLFTIEEYAKDPDGYDADASWQRAMDVVLGHQGRRVLAPFFEMFGDDAADTNFLEPLHFLRDTIDLDTVDETTSLLENSLRAARAIADSSTERFRKIIAELEPTVSRARRRINTMRGDRRYQTANGLLVYPTEEGRVAVPRVIRQHDIDGNLDDWSDAVWHDLTGPIDGEVSFAADGSHLHIAIRARVEQIDIRDGPQVGEGTHVGLIVTHDNVADQISSRDLFLLVGPGGDGATDPRFLGAMKFEGFMAKWLADNENLTFTNFHLTTFGDTIGTTMSEVATGIQFDSQQQDVGFTMEIRVPHRASNQRISLIVSSRVNGRMRSSALADRNYPLNPSTFVTLRLPIP